MQRTVSNVVSGMIFGSGLTLSGVASPQVIRDQFNLTDFHMLVTFLTASATSAAVFATYNSRSTVESLPIKLDSTLGWIGKHDGNFIGGAMIGLGMSLTGACPGTLLVQAAAGTGKSRLLASVAVLAGIAFAKWKQHAIVHIQPSKGSYSTVMAATGWSLRKTVILYETILVSAIAAVLILGKRSDPLLHPIAGGLLIGVGQISSVLLVKRPVGVSSAYQDLGNLACKTASGKPISTLPDSLLFAAGLIAGASVTMRMVPAAMEALVGSEVPSSLSVLIGGFVLIFGARIAGGCTSGHGISGMASMSVSSLVTVASMFGTGIVASFLIDRI